MQSCMESNHNNFREKKQFLKVHSHVTSEFAFFFDLSHSVLGNADVKCEPHHLLPLTAFLTFEVKVNAETQKLRVNKA